MFFSATTRKAEIKVYKFRCLKLLLLLIKDVKKCDKILTYLYLKASVIFRDMISTFC